MVDVEGEEGWEDESQSGGEEVDCLFGHGGGGVGVVVEVGDLGVVEHGSRYVEGAGRTKASHKRRQK